MKRFDVFVERKVVIIFEVEAIRKNVKIEVGPPIKSKKHYAKFVDKHPQNFVVGDRIWALAEPRFRNFSDLVYAIEDKLGSPKIYTEQAMSKAYKHYYEKEKQFVCRFLLKKEVWEI